MRPSTNHVIKIRKLIEGLHFFFFYLNAAIIYLLSIFLMNLVKGHADNLKRPTEVTVDRLR